MGGLQWSKEGVRFSEPWATSDRELWHMNAKNWTRVLSQDWKTFLHTQSLSALSNDKEIDATTIKWNTRFGLACEGDEQEMRGSLKNEFYQCSFPGADSFCHCGQERKGHCNLENTSCAGQRASYLPFTALKSSLFYTHSDERETKHVWE